MNYWIHKWIAFQTAGIAKANIRIQTGKSSLEPDHKSHKCQEIKVNTNLYWARVMCQAYLTWAFCKADYYEAGMCGTIIVLLLYVRKLQLRELKELARGQSAKWQSSHRNSGVLPLSSNKYWPSMNSKSGSVPGPRYRKMKNKNVGFLHRVYTSGRIYKHKQI